MLQFLGKRLRGIEFKKKRLLCGRACDKGILSCFLVVN
jgi:hypothetical protein